MRFPTPSVERLFPRRGRNHESLAERRLSGGLTPTSVQALRRQGCPRPKPATSRRSGAVPTTRECAPAAGGPGGILRRFSAWRQLAPTAGAPAPRDTALRLGQSDPTGFPGSEFRLQPAKAAQFTAPRVLTCASCGRTPRRLKAELPTGFRPPAQWLRRLRRRYPR